MAQSARSEQLADLVEPAVMIALPDALARVARSDFPDMVDRLVSPLPEDERTMAETIASGWGGLCGAPHYDALALACAATLEGFLSPRFAAAELDLTVEAYRAVCLAYGLPAPYGL